MLRWPSVITHIPGELGGGVLEGRLALQHAVMKLAVQIKVPHRPDVFGKGENGRSWCSTGAACADKRGAVPVPAIGKPVNLYFPARDLGAA